LGKTNYLAEINQQFQSFAPMLENIISLDVLQKKIPPFV